MLLICVCFVYFSVFGMLSLLVFSKCFLERGRPLGLKKVLNLAMHNARIPPVDTTPATINAVLSMQTGHIFPRFLSLLRMPGREGYVARKKCLSYVFDGQEN